MGREKSKAVWLPATTGYDKGVRVVEGPTGKKSLVHYSIRKVLPAGMYEEVPEGTDIGTCKECLYWDHRLQCPAHVAGDGYWVLKRHYPQHLEWAVATYKPAWKGTTAPMLQGLRDHLTDSQKTSDEKVLAEIDHKLQRERLKRIIETPAQATTKLQLTSCSLNDRLTDAVIEVDREWKKVMKDKTRTGVQVK